jgi:hypothetical protein
MLDYLLAAAPPGMDGPVMRVDADLATTYQASQEFINTIRQRMDPGLERRGRFETEMMEATSHAEQAVEATPPEQRPEGIDHLALRRYAIAGWQCGRAITFLKKDRQKIQQHLLNKRPDLVKRFNSIKPQ